MARATRITKIKFHSINRDIRTAVETSSFNAIAIAKVHHVSPESVRSIRRSKTWPGFITAKQLRSTMISRQKADQFEKSQSALQVGPVKKFTKDLKGLMENPVQYVTVKQFTDAIDSLNGKITQDRTRSDIHQSRIDAQGKRLDRYGLVLNRIQKLKPRWFREN